MSPGELTGAAQDLQGLLYFAVAGLVTLGIDSLRRFINHKLTLWEKESSQEAKDDDES